jgi:hypothetical protein
MAASSSLVAWRWSAGYALVTVTLYIFFGCVCGCRSHGAVAGALDCGVTW